MPTSFTTLHDLKQFIQYEKWAGWLCITNNKTKVTWKTPNVCVCVCVGGGRDGVGGGVVVWCWRYKYFRCTLFCFLRFPERYFESKVGARDKRGPNFSNPGTYAKIMHYWRIPNQNQIIRISHKDKLWY